jgi:Flp pilus assembly protein TadG
MTVEKNALATTGTRRRLFFARGLTRTDAGSALVEMVVIAPLLLFLLIGLIEVGQIGDYAIRVGNAARAGVQFGAQNEATAGDTQGMQNAANADAQYASITSVAAATFCQCADGTASTCQQGDCATTHRLQWVEVTASGTFASALNSKFLPANLKSITISRTATMRVAQ